MEELKTLEDRTQVEWALKAAKSKAKAMATDDSQMETTITKAVRSRSSYFRKQSDSLTFEGVRRLLEKDLGLETFTLDGHKQLIKKLLQENFDSSEDDDASGNLTENETEAEDSKLEKRSGSSDPLEHIMQTEDNGGLKEQEDELPEKQAEEETDSEKPDQDETGQAGLEIVDTDVKDEKEPSVEVNEAVIREAFSKRASYLRANIESISMGGVRRLLEQDLQLQKKALDAHKTLIGKLVDEVLTGPVDSPDDVKETKKKSQKKKSSKGKENDSKQVEKKKFDSTEDSIESTGISRDDEEIEESSETLKESKTKKRKKEDVASKTLKGKKRKKEPDSEEKKSARKVFKKQKAVKDEDTEQVKPESMRRKEVESESGDESPAKHQTSEDTGSDSSVDKVIKKEVKKTTNATVVHGEQVEQLKKIIKACGMTIPPVVYRKARQFPESKQEAHLIQELMAILNREGLSSSSTDKEIRAVKKRKEKAKELEGIDTTNIISEPRGRRATSNFFHPPPQYKASDEEDDDSDDEDDSKSSEDDEPVIEEEESD